MVLSEILVTLGVAVGRSITGWMTNAFKDGKIDDFEWSQLGATIIQVAVLTVGISYGFKLDTTASAFGALVGSYIISALTKKKK